MIIQFIQTSQRVPHSLHQEMNVALEDGTVSLDLANDRNLRLVDDLFLDQSKDKFRDLPKLAHHADSTFNALYIKVDQMQVDKSTDYEQLSNLIALEKEQFILLYAKMLDKNWKVFGLVKNGEKDMEGIEGVKKDFAKRMNEHFAPIENLKPFQKYNDQSVRSIYELVKYSVIKMKELAINSSFYMIGCNRGHRYGSIPFVASYNNIIRQGDTFNATIGVTNYVYNYQEIAKVIIEGDTLSVNKMGYAIYEKTFLEKGIYELEFRVIIEDALTGEHDLSGSTTYTIEVL